jgi:hypothetical protein
MMWFCGERPTIEIVGLGLRCRVATGGGSLPVLCVFCGSSR